MTRAKIGLLALIFIVAALASFSVYHGRAGTVPIILAQVVQHNEPFVYGALNGPNDYNWEGDWNPRMDRDWYDHYHRDRDTGGVSGAGASCTCRE
jgi:hypothetical protein